MRFLSILVGLIECIILFVIGVVVWLLFVPFYIVGKLLLKISGSDIFDDFYNVGESGYKEKNKK